MFYQRTKLPMRSYLCYFMPMLALLYFGTCCIPSAAWSQGQDKPTPDVICDAQTGEFIFPKLPVSGNQYIYPRCLCGLKLGGSLAIKTSKPYFEHGSRVKLYVVNINSILYNYDPKINNYELHPDLHAAVPSPLNQLVKVAAIPPIQSPTPPPASLAQGTPTYPIEKSKYQNCSAEILSNIDSYNKAYNIINTDIDGLIKTEKDCLDKYKGVSNVNWKIAEIIYNTKNNITDVKKNGVLKPGIRSQILRIEHFAPLMQELQSKYNIKINKLSKTILVNYENNSIKYSILDYKYTDLIKLNSIATDIPNGIEKQIQYIGSINDKSSSDNLTLQTAANNLKLSIDTKIFQFKRIIEDSKTDIERNNQLYKDKNDNNYKQKIANINKTIDDATSNIATVNNLSNDYTITYTAVNNKYKQTQEVFSVLQQLKDCINQASKLCSFAFDPDNAPGYVETNGDVCLDGVDIAVYKSLKQGIADCLLANPKPKDEPNKPATTPVVNITQNITTAQTTTSTSNSDKAATTDTNKILCGSITVPSYNRPVLDYALGAGVNWLTARSYRVAPLDPTDANSPKIVREGASSAINGGPVLFFHYYYTSVSGPGLALSVGVDSNNQQRYLFGGSLVFGGTDGRKNASRLFLTLGCAVGQITMLNGVKVGQVFNGDPNTLTSQGTMFDPFISLSALFVL